VIDGNDTISALSQLRLTATGTAEFNVDLNGRSEKAVIMGEIYRHKDSWKLRRKGRGLTADWSHWLSAMVSMSHSQKYPAGGPDQSGEEAGRESTALISLAKKPVFLLPNTSWIPLKPESLLFSMPQAL
jgi:hypothetical protein